MESNPPRDVMRDGNLKASIWRNEGEKGPFYSASLARTYKDQNGDLHDAHSFAGSELLRVAELARKAYDRTRELHRDESKSPDRDASREAFKTKHNQDQEQDNSRITRS